MYILTMQSNIMKNNLKVIILKQDFQSLLWNSNIFHEEVVSKLEIKEYFKI